MIRYSIMILILAVTLQLQGQTRNITGVKINPLGAFNSSIPIIIERTFGQLHYSAVIGGAIIHNRSGSGDNTYNNDGFAITPGFRYYFSNDPDLLSRTYLGTWLNYEEHSNTTVDRLGIPVDGKAFGRGAGVVFGNQWFFKNGFLVDFYIGPAYMKYEADENYNLNVSKGGFLTSITGPKNTGTKVNFGFSMGLRF